MAEYKFYTVKIPVELGSELHKRLEQSAQVRGISFEETLEEAVQIGSWEHIARNLDMIERYSAKPV